MSMLHALLVADWAEELERGISVIAEIERAKKLWIGLGVEFRKGDGIAC